MDQEAKNRMTLKWALLLFSKIKKHHHLGTKIRKVETKKNWQLRKATSIYYFLLYLLKMVKKNELESGKEYSKDMNSDILLCLCMNGNIKA